MKKNIYKTAKTNCPICFSDNLQEYAVIRRFADPFHIDRCSECGHLFMNPAWSKDYIESLYGKDYYQEKADYSYHDERKQLKFEQIVWRARLRNIRTFVRGGNFLDIGCSFGGFLREAGRYFQPYGVELSPYAADYAGKNIDGEIFQGKLEDAPFAAASMDVITAIEVVEHIEDIEAFFKKAGELLRPGGLIVLQTADFDGWQAIRAGSDYHYFLPGHLHYYTSANLRKILYKWSGIGNFYEFRGTDFGLIPKLLKSRSNFNSLSDYRRWMNISSYHLKSKIRWKGHYLTSAMVLYGIKK